ncbi:MAG: heavy metal translocating P-type ATPase, partial [Burkholderiales bacterium]|nr:heavy metal translocating P-type ATPase [Burkholderiales bacterium]
DRRKPDGTFEPVSVRRLTVGDVVRVQAGQAFPGDGVLLSERVTVDEALLTGESHPVTRAVGEALIAGSFNLASPVEMRVDKLGRDTRFAQIVALMEKASTEKPRLAILADRIAAPFLVLVLLAAVAAFLYWWQIDHSRAFAVAVSVLIVTCPCALSLATPAAMLASAGSLAKRGVLVRRLQAFEALANVDTVIFDKTGTLTLDKVVLSGIQVRAGVTATTAMALGGSLAAASLHPASRAILKAANEGWGGQGGLSPEPAAMQVNLGQVAEHAGQGMSGSHSVFGLVRLGSAAFCGVTPVDQAAVTSPRVYLTDAQGWLATFELDEGLRPDAREAVAALQAMGIQTCLLSGDRPGAAQRIARLVGIDTVVAEAGPEQKLQEVIRLQAAGHTVAMVGDGLNDGPVLARANTSFALGTAAPLAQAQSDFVIQGGNVFDVVKSVTQARKTLIIVKQNLIWAAVYNSVSVPLALAGFMPPWLAGLGMAISSFWVIGNALRLNQGAEKTNSSFREN